MLLFIIKLLLFACVNEWAKCNSRMLLFITKLLLFVCVNECNDVTMCLEMKLIYCILSVWGVNIDASKLRSNLNERIKLIRC